jgi:hypothetical protein
MDDTLYEEYFVSEDINLTGTSSTTSQAEIFSNISGNVNNLKMSILDGTYFDPVFNKSTDKTLVGVRKKCLPNYVEIKGYKNCTSNFVTYKYT